MGIIHDCIFLAFRIDALSAGSYLKLQNCSYYMLRKAGIISQDVGGLVGNSISTDVSMVDNSIRLYLTSVSEEKYITDLHLEGTCRFIS